MKKIAHYVVYMDDGEHVYKLHTPAVDEKGAREYWKGNGDVVAVKKGEREPSCPISTELVAEALARYSFGELEIDLITRTLQSATDFCS